MGLVARFPLVHYFSSLFLFVINTDIHNVKNAYVLVFLFKKNPATFVVQHDAVEKEKAEEVVNLIRIHSRSCAFERVSVCYLFQMRVRIRWVHQDAGRRSSQ